MSDVSGVSYKGPDQGGPENRGERRGSFWEEESGPLKGPYRVLMTVHLRADLTAGMCHHPSVVVVRVRII